MFNLSDVFIFIAVIVSFAVSGFTYFSGHEMQGLFSAVWVPSILAFGIYFKLASLVARSKKQ